jgi:hypothetical protein
VKFAEVLQPVAIHPKNHHPASIEDGSDVGTRSAEQDQVTSNRDGLAESIARGGVGNGNLADELPRISDLSVYPGATTFLGHSRGAYHQQIFVDREHRAELVAGSGLRRSKSVPLDESIVLRRMNRHHACRRRAVSAPIVADEDEPRFHLDGASEPVDSIDVERCVDEPRHPTDGNRRNRLDGYLGFGDGGMQE